MLHPFHSDELIYLRILQVLWITYVLLGYGDLLVSDNLHQSGGVNANHSIRNFDLLGPGSSLSQISRRVLKYVAGHQFHEPVGSDCSETVSTRIVHESQVSGTDILIAWMR